MGGQITANKGDQQKFDTDMTKVAQKIPVWPTPANMELMGAKDALTMIKDMDFGLPDTLGYYSPADIKAGFPKTIALRSTLWQNSLSGVRMDAPPSLANGHRRAQAHTSREEWRLVAKWSTNGSALVSVKARRAS